MKKKTKVKYICVCVVDIILLGVVIYYLFFFNNGIYNPFKNAEKNIKPTYENQSNEGLTEPDIAKNSESIDFDRKSDLLYINNEVIVVMRVGHTSADAEKIAKQINADITSSIENSGLYQFTFKQAMSLDEIKASINELKKSEDIEDVFINSISETG